MRRILVASLALFLVVGAAMGDTMYNYWNIQRTGVSLSSTEKSLALGMRGGNAWPVIFSPEVTVGLFPSGWSVIGHNQTGGQPRAASSSKGNVAAIGQPTAYPSQEGYGVVSGNSGWTSISADAITFDNQGRLWKADKNGWVFFQDSVGWHSLGQFTKEPTNSFKDIAIAVAGDGTVGIGAVTDTGDVRYYDYSPLSARWQRDNSTIGAISGPISMAFDAHGMPHIVGTMQGTESTALAFEYHSETDTWGTQTIGMNVNSSYLPIAVSDNGLVATAFLQQENGISKLTYSAEGQDGMWNSMQVPFAETIDSSSYASVGLAFDYNNLPVIAFYGGNQPGIYLAYDPEVAPEPAVLAFLATGAFFGLRRRR